MITRTIRSSLIVSSDAKATNQLTPILMQHDYTVTIEKSVLKFISLLLEQEVDLLILDLDSPDEKNFDSIDIIRKLRPRLPIIALSKNHSLELLKELVQKGIFYAAQKPVLAEEIEEMLLAASKSTRNSDKRSYSMKQQKNSNNGSRITLLDHDAG